MTARSTRPESMAISAKREDMTPKTRRQVRGNNSGRGLDVARTRGRSTASAESAAEIDVDKPLTDKQKAFVKFWAQGESITSASVKAGYNDSASIAYRMVRMPNVLALKAQYEAQYQEEAQMTRKRVMDGMLESIDMARLMSEPATMLQGWKTIGQLCGYFAPVEHKVKVDVTGNVIIDKLNSMSDAELLKIISQGASAAMPGLLS